MRIVEVHNYKQFYDELSYNLEAREALEIVLAPDFEFKLGCMINAPKNVTVVINCPIPEVQIFSSVKNTTIDWWGPVG